MQMRKRKNWRNLTRERSKTKIWPEQKRRRRAVISHSKFA
jgi:hypothetical protein